MKKNYVYTLLVTLSTISMVKEKKTRRIYSMSDIKPNMQNLQKPMLACLPILSIWIMFREKEDLFARYHSVIYSFATIMLITRIQVVVLISIIMFMYGLVRVSKGKRVALPFIDNGILKIMSYIDNLF